MKDFLADLKREEYIALELRRLYRDYGYTKISLPAFEDYDLYMDYRDYIKTEKIVTLMSPNGKLLALRPDITLSIAKKVYKEKNFTYEKIYYIEDVYKFSSHEIDGYKVENQLGIERICNCDIHTDQEILDLAIKSLNKIDDENILVFSHVGILSNIIDEIAEKYSIDNDTVNEIIFNIQQKSFHELNRILEKLEVNNNNNVSLQLLNDMHKFTGKFDNVYKQLLSYKLDKKTKNTLLELNETYKLLIKNNNDNKDKIVFDLSTTKNLDYYNGIIFQGYIKNSSKAILTGGRYDKLFNKFGINKGAIGFAIHLESLK